MTTNAYDFFLFARGYDVFSLIFKLMVAEKKLKNHNASILLGNFLFVENLN